MRLEVGGSIMPTMAEFASPPAGPARVAIWPLVAGSYRGALGQVRLAAALGWFWLAAAWLLSFAMSLLVATEEGRLLGEVLSMPLIIGFAVAWHRATLIGEAPKGWFKARFGARELRYTAMIVLLMLLFFGVLLLAALIYLEIAGQGRAADLPWGIAAAGLIGLFFATRFILVFPSIALGDRRVGLRRSWQLTRGHGAALFAGFCGACLPLALLKYVVLGAVYLATHGHGLAGQLLQAALLPPLFLALDFAGTAACVGFMSCAYRAFTSR
jgi:hypothetical protein